ncbi:hypothetical protein Tco_0526078 [Tanacetum coccineum]
MRTRSQARISVPEPPVRQPSVESSNLEKPDTSLVTMADNLLWRNCSKHHRGYEDAIVIPEITANNFEIKHGLLNLLLKDCSSRDTRCSIIRFLERYVTAMIAVLRNMQNPRSKLQFPNVNLYWTCFQNLLLLIIFTFRFWTLPGNTVTNPKEDLKGITTRSGVTIQGPKAVNHDVEVTKDTMPPANNGSTEDVQPPVVQIQSRNQNPEPNVAPVVTPVPKASIPFPSRRNDERRKEKANDQIRDIYEILEI